MKNIECNHMTCKNCKRSVRLKRKWCIIRKYRCDFIDKKHKEISADKCKGFLCKERDDAYEKCRKCSKTINI